jgi:hypothetical protein
VLVKFSNFEINFHGDEKSSPTHSSLYTEREQNTSKTSCLGVEEFHTIDALSSYIFIYGNKQQTFSKKKKLVLYQ